MQNKSDIKDKIFVRKKHRRRPSPKLKNLLKIFGKAVKNGIVRGVGK